MTEIIPSDLLQQEVIRMYCFNAIWIYWRLSNRSVGSAQGLILTAGDLSVLIRQLDTL